MALSQPNLKRQLKMRKPKDNRPMLAAVALLDAKPVYTRFGRDLEQMIIDIEFFYGVVRIEKAHANEPPLWVRIDD